MAYLEIEERIAEELLEKLEFNSTAVSALESELSGLRELVDRLEKSQALLVELLTAERGARNAAA